jgi:hypothetical protein
MSRRMLVAFASLALAAPLAHASDEPVRLPLRDSLVRMAPRLDLMQLFARLDRNAPSVETADGVNSPMNGMELVVARIGADGKVVMACVDNARAAAQFFEAPVERIGRRKAQNQ